MTVSIYKLSFNFKTDAGILNYLIGKTFTVNRVWFAEDLFGLKLSPAAFLYDEWSGLYENEKGKLYINDGIGTVGFFARFGAKPEITLITLKKSL